MKRRRSQSRTSCTTVQCCCGKCWSCSSRSPVCSSWMGHAAAAATLRRCWKVVPMFWLWIASLIVKMRRTSPFRETLPLARAIEKLVGRHGRHHPATQVFQALRMEVNDELGALEEGLRILTARLAPSGRIAVITFHSLEDRIVKNFFRDHSREWLDKPEWPEPQL